MAPKKQRKKHPRTPILTADELKNLGLTEEDLRRIDANEAQAVSRPVTLTYSKTWTCHRCHRSVDCGRKCPECGDSNCCE
jgi:hypothetical protein